MMMAGKRTLRVLTTVGVLLMCANNLSAQDSANAASLQSTATDPRWAPWLGCWELLDEGLRDGIDPASADRGWPSDPLRARLDALRERSSRQARSAAGDLRVCVRPGESTAAVRVTTLAGNSTLQEETIVSDGARRVIQEPECTGWRQAEWSQNGHRLFANAELACANEPFRRVSGIALMAPAGVWVDIQVVALGGRESVRVRRYRPADSEAVSAASRARLVPPFSIDDVIEAALKAGSASTTAALVELGMGFELNGRTLVRLEEAGVSPGVIDVMVAVAYPDRFQVQRAAPTRRSALQSMSLGGIDNSDPYPYDYYSPFGYSSFFERRAYASYGYSPWGAYSPYYLGGLTTIVVVPSDGRDRPADSSGRAVNGRGYTRERPRDEAAEGTRGSSGQERTSGTADSPRSGSAASSGGTSTGGTVSPRGASSGGGGGDSGRTARPR